MKKQQLAFVVWRLKLLVQQLEVWALTNVVWNVVDVICNSLSLSCTICSFEVRENQGCIQWITSSRYKTNSIRSNWQVHEDSREWTPNQMEIQRWANDRTRFQSQGDHQHEPTAIVNQDVRGGRMQHGSTSFIWSGKSNPMEHVGWLSYRSDGGMGKRRKVADIVYVGFWPRDRHANCMDHSCANSRWPHQSFHVYAKSDLFSTHNIQFVRV